MTGEQTETGVHARFGYVWKYDPETHRARVQFPDKDNLISAWIPVAVPNTKKNKDECPLDKDEHVLCLFMGNGLEEGVVLCSIWDDKNKPIVKDKDIRVTTFEDGTVISYDRKKHLLTIDVKGNVEIYGDRIDLNKGR